LAVLTVQPHDAARRWRADDDADDNRDLRGTNPDRSNCNSIDGFPPCDPR